MPNKYRTLRAGLTAAALCCGMLNTLPSLNAFAEDETFTDETLTYTKISGGVSITACSASTSSISISSTIDGYPILEIGEGAFADCAQLSKIDLSKSKIRSIGSGAFTGCTKLQEIKLPDTLTKIDAGAFYNCTSLSTMEMPDSVTEVGDYAFAYCFSLADITLSNKLTSLPSAMFYYDIGLENVTLPKSIETLNSLCFVSCASLKELYLPASVSDVEPMALLNCSGLKQVTVDDKNETYCTGDDGALYTKNGETLVLYPAGNGVTDCVLPDTVTAISDYAFAGSLSLETVTLNSIEQFPEGCFSDCVLLKSVNCSADAFQTIPASLFAGCQKLENFTLPENCTSIGNYAFYECKSLTEISIPASVKEIGRSAFCGCDAMNTITIPPETVVGSYAVGFSVPEDDSETPVLRTDFVLHGHSSSDAKRYANEYDVKFKQDNFNFRFWGFSLGIFFALLALFLTIKDLVAKKKTKTAEEAAQGTVTDPNYKSILDDTDGDPYERNFGVTDEEDDSEDISD